ncbi:FkbM family methyltransferase [Sinorhizobium meliloti]|uniref:FkbM family methyltransferase n=1 Tax=Rhizobium meliloti TaxID=382 RepID=UPI002380C420|nr:FkbM family methyltransferase [Sinorhizobium meliloti]MDE3816103.1 FkbM family methyltransferase [Sinorhizobium meliloti]MDW9807390.1 FkbM family methyltransferase [Sinorhizobium meliloti]MDX0278481.1 FkbM family methyltransferase [Sinorhizobium meliloti]
MTGTATSIPAFWRKAQNWADKARWGFRVVGVSETLRGAARMSYLYLRRPKSSELQLRSGQILEFGFPHQVPKALLMFGDFIDPEFPLLRRIARPDWVVADIGAAIGQFTLFAATLPVTSVHAFEPGAVNVAVLARNVEHNGVGGRVHIHKLAFSSEESESYFETTARTWMGGLSDTGTELVSVRTLTAEFERLGLDRVSVLKINVAGYEPKVLEGADRFLARGGADVLVLLLGLASLPWYGKLAAYGYRFFYYHPNENVLYEVVAFDADAVLAYRPWPARNIVAIHQGVAKTVIDPSIQIRRIQRKATSG